MLEDFKCAAGSIANDDQFESSTKLREICQKWGGNTKEI